MGREVRVEVLGLLERRVEVGVVVGGGGEMIADLGENWNEEEINEQESRGGGGVSFGGEKEWKGAGSRTLPVF